MPGRFEIYSRDPISLFYGIELKPLRSSTSHPRWEELKPNISQHHLSDFASWSILKSHKLLGERCHFFWFFSLILAELLFSLIFPRLVPPAAHRQGLWKRLPWLTWRRVRTFWWLFKNDAECTRNGNYSLLRWARLGQFQKNIHIPLET